jgi:hypothetical protein
MPADSEPTGSKDRIAASSSKRPLNDRRRGDASLAAGAMMFTVASETQMRRAGAHYSNRPSEPWRHRHCDARNALLDEDDHPHV